MLLCVSALRAEAPLHKSVPAFELPTLQKNGFVSLQRFNGQWVLLDFWASWCPPCKKSLPELGRIKNHFPQLNILALSVDENNKKAEDFLSKMPANLVYLHDAKKSVAEFFDIKGMPTLILIDPQGKISERIDGYSSESLESFEKKMSLLISPKVGVK